MDKKDFHKTNKGISPLTPCRPVGLRRKHTGIKNTISPSLDLLKNRDITSPISTNPGSIKVRVLAELPPPINVQDCPTETDATKELENVGNNASKGNSNKRKATFSHSRSIARKVICSDSANPTVANTDSPKNQMLNCKEEKSLLNKNCIPVTGVSKDSDIAKGVETDKSGSHSPSSVIINKEDSVEKRYITRAEINTLREQIAAKEKKLKELELAALYKKKHDPEQVAKEIECWLRGCKEALHDLQSELAKRNQSYTLYELLQKLGIPSSLLEIDEDSE